MARISPPPNHQLNFPRRTRRRHSRNLTAPMRIHDVKPHPRLLVRNLQLKAVRTPQINRLNRNRTTHIPNHPAPRCRRFKLNENSRRAIPHGNTIPSQATTDNPHLGHLQTYAQTVGTRPHIKGTLDLFHRVRDHLQSVTASCQSLGTNRILVDLCLHHQVPSVYRRIETRQKRLRYR